jgi:uncharacterized membrane protein YeaQ/YmgE (transglycosylase-associated protein family)
MHITLWEFLFLLLIAAVCGGIARALVGFTRGGLLVAIAVGFIGALIGMWLQRRTAAPEILTVQLGDTSFPIIWSIIGGVLFALAISWLTPRPSRWAS